MHLVGARELIAARLGARSGHYMNPALLDSQFAALESPGDALRLDVGPTPEQLADAACAGLARIPRTATARAPAR